MVKRTINILKKIFYIVFACLAAMSFIFWGFGCALWKAFNGISDFGKDTFDEVKKWFQERNIKG